MSVLDGFKIKSERIMSNHPEFPVGSTAWRVTVTNPRGKTFTRKFYMGPAIKGEPTLELFMSGIVMDANSGANYPDVNEFASEFGYELETGADRRYVARIRRACIKINERMEDFLTTEERELFEQM